MNVARTFDAAAAPLDQLRRAAMRWALARPALRPWLLDRGRRVGAHALLGAAVSLSLTALWPALLFVLGPLLLGVAHVTSDVRYLLLRRSVPRGVVALAALFCAAFFVLRCVELWGPSGVKAAHELMLLEVWAGASVVAAGLDEGRAGRAAAGLAATLSLGYVAQRWPELTRLAFAHLHNLIGVGLWLWLFRGRLGPVLPALSLLLVGVLVTGSGATITLAERVGGLSFAGQDLLAVVSWVAPSLPHRLAVGAMLSYVFLQAIHYSVWLAWVPQDDTRAEGTTSFRMSLRSLRADLGWLLIPVAAAATLVPLLAIPFGAPRTRDVYLALASFHGYLEIAMAAYFFVAPSARERPR